MNTTEPEILPADQPLPETQRADLLVIWGEFRQKFEKLKVTAETLSVTSVTQKAEMKLARATRLELKAVRVAVEKRRKELGEEYLKKTQAINGAAKELKDLIEPLEAKLLEQEEFAEREEKRIKDELIASRSAVVVSHGKVPAHYALGDMSEEEYQAMIAGFVAAKEAAEKAAREAEEARIAKEKADAEERERIRIENERLRKEAEAREALEAAEAQRKAAEAAALKAKQDEEKKAAKAPDKTKLTNYAAKLSALLAPEMATEEATAIARELDSRVASLVEWVKAKVKSL